jgi:ATP-dependent DNA helicase DinG
VTATASATTGPRTFAEAEDVLAASLPGYTPRKHQQELAAAIERAIGAEAILVAEAGTGTGKSLAALIPAIVSGKRVVVATATKALQDQYASKDLPFLQEHLGVDFTWAILKGRSNYPCASKIADLQVPSARQAQILALIAEHEAADDSFTDRDGLPTTTDREWMQLSISPNECPGASDCPFAEQGKCFAYRAKAKASRSQVVVTNLAYLAIDLKLREETGGSISLLGEIDLLIIDEAHNLDQAVTSALSDRIALGTVMRLVGDAGSWMRQAEIDGSEPEAAGWAAQQLWATIETEYRAWQERRRAAREDDKTMPVTLNTRLVTFGTELQQLAGALRLLGTVIRRADVDPGGEGWGDMPAAVKKMKRLQARLARRVDNLLVRLESFATDEDDVSVRWIEAEEDKIFIRAVPVSPAPFLREAIWSQTPAVLMSATLAPGRTVLGEADFSYTIGLLGLEDFGPVTFESGTPFDYPSQAMLYVPDRDRPLPAGKTRAAWQVFAQQATEWLVRESGGGALLLFTSRSAMNQTWDALHERLEEAGLECLKQGDAPTSELLRRFKEDGNAVLFALRTFFEGVDIPGDALRLVVIDKLPFPVPTDLQYAARCEAVNRRAGRDVSFRKLAMPVMTLPLVQAVGRLLRTKDDSGVLAILDPRLTAKPYGKQILASLPPAHVTTDPREAGAFMKAHQG